VGKLYPSGAGRFWLAPHPDLPRKPGEERTAVAETLASQLLPPTYHPHWAVTGRTGITLAQERAGAGHHDVAFHEAIADFDLAAGHQSGFDPAGLDPLALDHLHHGAGAAIEDGGERHRYAAALAGL